MKKSYFLVSLAACLLTISLGTGNAADWPEFRGPDGSAVSDATNIPAEWSETENLIWKTKMPGMGASSPIYVGGKIYLTAYSGYGQNKDNPGEMEKLVHHALCYDMDGKLVWEKKSRAGLPDTEYRGFMPLHGYASSTPASDGNLVYFFFGRAGVYARNPETGELVWSKNVGEGTHGWGSATSLILYKNLVIVNASIESEAVIALDKKTGKEVWRLGGIKKSWSTPALVKTADGKTELVVSLAYEAWGVDPDTGEKLWWCSAVPDDYVCPAVVANDGVAYVFGGRKPRSVAIRPGGKGDVSETHVLWESNASTKVPTPVYSLGYLYWIDQGGMARCLDAKTGEEVYTERLELAGSGERLYGSPIIVDGKYINASREDGVVVLAVPTAAGEKPEFKVLARNYFADDTSVSNATPAMADGKLILRSDAYLYCIGKK